jgi:winged helix-turn-helix DNA-binding protein
MSVLDDLRGLETRVTDRMAELRPLVDEYRELERVAQRLGLGDTAQPAGPAASNGRTSRRGRGATGTTPKRTAGRAGAKPEPSGARPPAAAKAPRSKRRAVTAAPGERRQQVLDAVSKRPGITVSAIAKQLGVDPTSLYRSVRELERAGAIDKRGTELHPA